MSMLTSVCAVSEATDVAVERSVKDVNNVT
jgi:hypothetical protein